MTEGAEHAADLFVGWLSSKLTGCSYATSFAKGASARVKCYTVVGVPSADDLPSITAFIDSTADEKKVPVLIFPTLRSHVEVAQLIKMLAGESRWSPALVPWNRHPREDAVLIGLYWTTKAGLRSSAMGFAPFGTMPVTRRAPYVGLALWAGGYDNEYAPRGKELSLVHAPTGLQREPYDEMWLRTKQRAADLLSQPPEDGAQLRKAAFCLHKEASDQELIELLSPS